MAAPAPPTADWSFSEENTPQSQVTGGEVTQNGPRPWERAWSVHEMRSEAGKWSLAGDAGLLLHLQEFSQRLISRTHEIGQDMDGLVHEVKLTSVQVNNVVNNFIMLANTQFVENRVYDEDVNQEPTSQEDNKSEQQEKTREQRESELMPRVATALRLGMDVIDTAFEKVETATVESDSEEEDNAYRADPILEAKDPYLTRTLPFLIGSPQFLEDDNVGLMEELSEEEPESDHGSISASEEEQESEESETEYSTSGESGAETKQKAAQRKQKAISESDMSTDSQETDSDEDMFVTKVAKKISDHDEDSADVSNSEEEDNEDNEKSRSSAAATDFSSELAARLGVAVSKQQTKTEDSGEDDGWEQEYSEKKNKDTVRSDKQKQPKETKKEKKAREDVKEKTDKGKGKGKHSKVKDEGDVLFGKSEQQDDDDFFRKPGGLFSTGKGLFDDDGDADEEGDLFGEVEKSPKKSQRKQRAEKNDGSSDETKDEDEEIQGKKAGDRRPRTKSGKLLPKGAVSVFGAGEDFLASVRSDTSDTHTIIKPMANSSALPVRSGGEGGLFDDNDEDDDFFGGVSHKKETVKKEASDSTRPVTTTAAATASKKVDLFAGDDDDEEDDLFGSMAAPTTKKKSHSNVGLIVEDEVKEETASKNETPRKAAVPEKKLPPGAVSMFGDGPNPFVAALKKQQKAAVSDEEDKDDWSEGETNPHTFTKPSTTTSATTRAAQEAKKFGLPVDTLGNDDDEFLATKTTSDSKHSEKTGKNLPGNNPTQNLPSFDVKKKAKASLFDDVDDEEDSDFFTAAIQPLERKQAAAVPVPSGADVSKQLQGNPEKTTTTRASTQSPGKNKRSLSLFDDDEGEDTSQSFFSRKPASAAVKTDSARRSSRDLFSDDDLLFAAGENENPSVDLFSSQGPLRQSSQEKDTPKPAASLPVKKATPTNKANTSNLFGGDGDDDEDLFSPGGLTKLPSSIAPSKLVADVKESDSAGDMETKEEEVKPDVSKPRRPAGAVSMFGGLDPSAILKKRRPPSASDDEKDKDDTKEEKQANKEEKETPVKEETAQDKSPVSKSPQAAVNLFTRDGDDNKDNDDDVFSSKSEENKVEGVTTGESTDTPDKEEVETPKPEPTKPKKPAGAVSMFGGMDPSMFLKRRKVEESDDDDDEKDKEKPPPPEPAPKTAPKPKLSLSDSTKPKPPGDLFGAADDDDADDLFGAPKKKVPPPTAPKTPLPTPTEPFKSEEELSVVEPAKPRKPAGAVAMFGGINPFAGLKKKSVSIEEDEKEPSPSRDEPKSPNSPTLLSPDGENPKLLERGDSVDFDQPAEVDALTSAIKDRPKLNRRRPQSRKARMLAATHTGISFEETTPTTPTTPTIPEVPDSLQDLPALDTTSSPNSATGEPSDKQNHDSGADKPEKAQSKSTDLFGNDDLLGGPSLSAGKLQVGGDEQSAKGDHLFGKGLFAGKGTQSSSDAANDLFSNSSASAASGSTLRSKTTVTSKTVVISKTSELKYTVENPKKINKEDDLVSTLPGKSQPGDVSVVLDTDDLLSPAAAQKSKPTSSNLQDKDDLFASSSVKSSSVGASTSQSGSDVVQSSKTTSALPASSEINTAAKSKLAASSPGDNDDIFKDSSLDKRTDTSKKTGSHSTTARNDNSVVNTSTQDSKSGRPRKAVTREAKLFSDTTDIFSDIPAATAREPKKKVVKKTTEKKAVLKDDVDDIFAETSAAGIKPKSETKKSLTKSAAVDSENIFDDPLI